MYLKKKRLGSVIPREEDLHGAAQALIRLQDVYELDIRDLSKGDLGRNRQRQVTKARLSAQDCLFMETIAEKVGCVRLLVLTV